MSYNARPVPQNIMSVEFKLFEFMTVKQFLIGFAVVVFCIVLFILIGGVWGLIIPLFVLMVAGIILFVPFNGEPFQVFVGSFLEAIISPQRRIWHKKGIVVKSAMRRARAYQYGNDPAEDGMNQFKYNETQQVKIGARENALDTKEVAFLENQSKEKHNNQSTTMNHTINQNNSGTAVSSKAVRTKVNLGQYTQANPASTQQGGQSAHTDSDASSDQAFPQHQDVPQSQAPVQQQEQPEIHVAPEANAMSSQNVPEEPKAQFLSSENAVSQPASNAVDISSDANTPQQTFLTSDDAVASNQSVPGSNSDQMVDELNQMMAPRSTTVQDDSVETTNYLFGSVEDRNGNPVKDAAVVIKRGEENLEVVYTGEGGDFQSHYEYRAGIYTLYVNVDSHEFNNVTIELDPVDPMPVIIGPHSMEDEVAEDAQAPDLAPATSPAEDGVFDGAYSSQVFKLGNDYQVESPVQNNETSTRAISSPEQTSQSSPQQSFNRDNSTSLVQQQAAPVNESQEQTALPREQRTIEDLGKEIRQGHGNQYDIEEHDNHQVGSANSSDNTAIQFINLPNATAKFDTTYSAVADTVNGMVTDSSGNPLPGVLIQIIDAQGNLHRTLATDPAGMFYTFAPLPQGDYGIRLQKDQYSFSEIEVNLHGANIPPKLIHSM